MRKYWLTFLMNLQTEMQYRANLVMWLVVGALAPLSMVMVWFAILGSRSEVGGYGHADFVMYYLFTTIGWYIVGGSFSRQVGRSIRNGDINKTLLKPYNIVLGAAASEQAWKVTSLFVTMPALAIVLYLMRESIVWRMPVGQIPYLLVVLVLSALIFALIEATVGILAFWVTEIWPITDMVEIIMYLFGGTLAPIALLPSTVQRITQWLPFRYIFYEPVTMMLGNQTDPTSVIVKQVVFVLVLYGIYRLVWRAGIKLYEGIGG